mmetsp:Transcript_2850/g.6439  ORF Transcript_2850/g.6439 Transcript_2850/m.6439 type:complete len:252 (+) Transcript_2850:878-1633(+)
MLLDEPAEQLVHLRRVAQEEGLRAGPARHQDVAAAVHLPDVAERLILPNVNGHHAAQPKRRGHPLDERLDHRLGSLGAVPFDVWTDLECSTALDTPEHREVSADRLEHRVARLPRLVARRAAVAHREGEVVVLERDGRQVELLKVLLQLGVARLERRPVRRLVLDRLRRGELALAPRLRGSPPGENLHARDLATVGRQLELGAGPVVPAARGRLSLRRVDASAEHDCRRVERYQACESCGGTAGLWHVSRR